jgi:GT2 family glycosyltransferase
MHGFDFTRTQEVEQPAATALMIRRDILEGLQGFDETYTILYNDVDLCRRMRDAGGRIFFTGETQLLHYGSSTTSSAPPPVRLEMYRNILMYFRRHHGVAAVWILTPILMVRLFIVTRSAIAFRLLRFQLQGDRP